ncbi:MAG: outer membrane beta-barrel protein [Verrucomicrobia bacterium]|nr:outer membrane beta-barrel protein [Verrucomicrobiota bacterium]
MTVQQNVMAFRGKLTAPHWIRWMAGVGACAALAGGERGLALEPEQILSPNLGKFAFQPQLDLSAQFTGNLFYGSDDPSPGGLVTLEREATPIPPPILPPGQYPVTVNTPAGDGVESDLLWYISPGMEIQYGANPENSLSFGYFHDFILYTKNSEFNAGQDRLQFDARAQVGRFTLLGSDTISWLDTILGGSIATAERVPVRRLYWLDNYRLTYDSSVKTDIYVVFNHDLQDFLQSISLYDIGTIRGTAGFTYKPTERIGIFVEAGGGHTDVTANLPPPPGPNTMLPGEDSWVYGGFVGVRGTFTPRITGSVKVGYETRSFTGENVQGDGGGAVVGVGLTYTPTARLLVNLTYDRRVGVSSQFAGQSLKNGTAALTATQQLGTSGRWSVIGRLGFSHGNFSGQTQTAVGVIEGVGPAVFDYDIGRDDQTVTASVGVQFQPRPWLTSALTYSFENYNADFNDSYTALTTGLNDFVVNRVNLQVSVGY